jgi:hypothetical protein
MSTVIRSLGSAVNCSQVQDFGTSTSPRTPKLHESIDWWGVGPADSTGKSCVTYWPGGTRPASDASPRRPRNRRCHAARSASADLTASRMTPATLSGSETIGKCDAPSNVTAEPPQLTPGRASASKAGTAFQRARRRKSTTRSVVACGCSSVIQCPQSGMIACSTLSATHRITSPIPGPNVASPPKAKTGI